MRRSLTWDASTDNGTPTAQLVYEVYPNGQFDQAVGCGYTQAILYVERAPELLR